MTLESDQASPEQSAPGLSRRDFIGSATAAIAVATVLGKSETAEAAPTAGETAGRRAEAHRLRVKASKRHLTARLPLQTDNGDELRYADFRSSYSKGLPHDAIGEVDPAAFLALRAAGESNSGAAWEAVPLGGARKQVSPQGSLSFELSGIDGRDTRIDPPPRFESAEHAAEMVEVYWQALTREVPFRQYGSDPLVADAVDELNAIGFSVDSGNLFRGETPGDLVGPYVSQFLWLDVPYGASTIVQRYPTPAPEDFMTDFPEWLAIQNGANPTRSITFGTPTYIHDGRTLGEYVRVDVSFQAFLNAGLICLGFGGAALSPTNPYRTLDKQAPFVNFGGPEILHLVTFASRAALIGAWFQKWAVHRWLRPEAFAGRIQNQVTGVKNYDVHPNAASSGAVMRLMFENGSALLPMAFPEGSPTHPAFPAGHGALAGACATVLKAFFDEQFEIPNPQEATVDGSSLDGYAGTLKLGGEFDKLAANIAIGRDTAGVHYRADGIDGILLGEQIGIGILRDYSVTHSEQFDGYQLTRFDGRQISIQNGRVSVL